LWVNSRREFKYKSEIKIKKIFDYYEQPEEYFVAIIRNQAPNV
jgi:hypothetical protein